MRRMPGRGSGGVALRQAVSQAMPKRSTCSFVAGVEGFGCCPVEGGCSTPIVPARCLSSVTLCRHAGVAQG